MLLISNLLVIICQGVFLQCPITDGTIYCCRLRTSFLSSRPDAIGFAGYTTFGWHGSGKRLAEVQRS
jgi:hypothetical protein